MKADLLKCIYKKKAKHKTNKTQKKNKKKQSKKQTKMKKNKKQKTTYQKTGAIPFIVLRYVLTLSPLNFLNRVQICSTFPAKDKKCIVPTENFYIIKKERLIMKTLCNNELIGGALVVQMTY